MLGDTAGFALDSLFVEESVEKGSFTVVDVPHHGDDWRTLGGVVRKFAMKMRSFGRGVFALELDVF